MKNKLQYFMSQQGFNDTPSMQPRRIVEDVKINGKSVLNNNNVANIVDYNIMRIEDYLYTIDYDNYDWKKGNKALKNGELPLGGGACSSVRNGNWFGRNYDWYYDNAEEFIIRVSGNEKRFASIGVASFPRITKSEAEKRKINELYDYLPFFTLDAINEYGVICNLNVVPSGDKGVTTGTHPGAKEEICQIMIARYVVDNFKTAREAAEYIRDNVNVYVFSDSHGNQELHAMIADEKDTLILEFINNQCVILDVSDKPYMTNFYIDGTTPNEDGTVYTPYTAASGKFASSNGITPYGAGLERYNLIVSNYDNIDNKDGMLELMTEKIKYTNGYTIDDDSEYWCTEMVSNTKTFGDLTVDTTYDKFNGIKALTKKYFAERSREKTREKEGSTWQTVHSSVYDIKNRILYIVVQEEGADNAIACSLFPNIAFSEYKPKYVSGELCFTALENSSIKLVKDGEPSEISLETSINGNKWQKYNIGNEIALNTNDKVYFRTTSKTLVPFSVNEGNYTFVMNGKISASGDITSLIKKDGNVTDIAGMNYCFHELFSGCEALTTAPELPVLKLANRCYDGMFKGCTSLTKAPKLPADTLFTSCYQWMFQGCTSLTEAPELPARYLVPNCYFSMFENCTSLVNAPELNALAIAQFCYAGMFSGCTSLETAPVLPAPGFDVSCYNNMFNGCTNLSHVECLVREANLDCTMNWLSGASSTGSFIRNESATNWERSESGIPEGWLVTAKK